MKAPMKISPSQVARADNSLRMALAFIDKHIPEDKRATKADPIRRAHKTLEAPPRYNQKQQTELFVALFWSMDFIRKYHEGKGVPELADASVLLSEIKLMTGEMLSGETV
jgi:hypothetical protein